MAASDNFFQKAELAVKKRNYEYAITLYQQGLAIDPDRLEERKNLRGCQVRFVQEKGGSTVGGGMFKIKNAKTIGVIAKLGKQKKFEEQIVEIEKLLTLAPQYAPALLAQAEAFVATNRPSSAETCFRWVVEVDPANTDAWKSLARLFQAQGDLEKAVECWERVKGVAPDDAEAGKAIRDLSAAVMMKRTEERKKASKEDSFRAMLKDEDESEQLQKQAQMIRTEDDALAAVSRKKAEIEANPGNSRLWREMGDLLAKIKKFDDAEKAYAKAAEVNPEDMYVAEKLGTLKEQRIQSAIEDAKIAVSNTPDDAAARAKLDVLLAEQNDFLLGELERRVAAHPTDFGLKSKFGDTLMKNERWDDAIAQFQLARKDPKFATSSTANIGRCFLAKGVSSLAIKELSTALGQINDRDSENWKGIAYDLASAHETKGNRDEACELFEEIMSVDINYRDVSARVDSLNS